MGTNAATQFPFDAALQLDDGQTSHAASGAGTVSGAAFVFDTMAGAPNGPGAPPVLENIRYGATAVVDVLSITGSDAITIQCSNDPTFATGVVTVGTVNMTAVGRFHTPIANFLGYGQGSGRYLRAYHTVTTGPVNAIVFLAPIDNLGY